MYVVHFDCMFFANNFQITYQYIFCIRKNRKGKISVFEELKLIKEFNRFYESSIMKIYESEVLKVRISKSHLFSSIFTTVFQSCVQLKNVLKLDILPSDYFHMITIVKRFSNNTVIVIPRVNPMNK